jgi:hypothetical protein
MVPPSTRSISVAYGPFPWESTVDVFAICHRHTTVPAERFPVDAPCWADDISSVNPVRLNEQLDRMATS